MLSGLSRLSIIEKRDPAVGSVFPGHLRGFHSPHFVTNLHVFLSALDPMLFWQPQFSKSRFPLTLPLQGFECLVTQLKAET